MFDESKINFSEGANASGTFHCAGCGSVLFEAHKKFEAHCGFPSFWQHLDGQVQLVPLDTYGRHRTQLRCNNCGLHLGHLFTNKQSPTGKRYCINEKTIVFKIEDA